MLRRRGRVGRQIRKEQIRKRNEGVRRTHRQREKCVAYMLAVTLCYHLLFDRNSSSPGEFLPSVPPLSKTLQLPLLHLRPHTDEINRKIKKDRLGRVHLCLVRSVIQLHQTLNHVRMYMHMLNVLTCTLKATVSSYHLCCLWILAYFSSRSGALTSNHCVWWHFDHQC